MVERKLGIDHTGIGTANIDAMTRFYDAVLGALGMSRRMQVSPDGGFVSSNDEVAGVGYGYDFPVFWIDTFHPSGTKNHTAFVAGSREEVAAFHNAGLLHGGSDNGPPRLRPVIAGFPAGYYAAFVIDPDGNNVEAVYREPVAP